MENNLFMKHRFFFILSLAVLLSGFTMQKKKWIIFFGDSITLAAVETIGYIKILDSILQQKGQDGMY